MSGQRIDAQSSTHRYRIGQKVKFAPGFGFSRTNSAAYEILALLPPLSSQFQYRVKCREENYERIVAENELILRQDG